MSGTSPGADRAADRPAGPVAPPDVTEVLVCVYYKVAAPGLGPAIAAVRELQRGMAAGTPGLVAELLLRSDHPGGLAPAAAPVPATPSPPADPTLMETYRLDARTTGASLDAIVASLARPAPSLQPWLRGDRHVEVFRPCAS